MDGYNDDIEPGAVCPECGFPCYIEELEEWGMCISCSIDQEGDDD